MRLNNGLITKRRCRRSNYAVFIMLTVWLATNANVVLAEDTGLGPADPADARPAPDFSISDLSGVQYSLGKTLVVNFWATWCPPCIKEMPALQDAWQQLKEHNVQVLGINMGETADDIQQFMQQASLDIDFPLLLDENMAQARSFTPSSANASGTTRRLLTKFALCKPIKRRYRRPTSLFAGRHGRPSLRSS